MSHEVGELIRAAGPRAAPPADAELRVRRAVEATWREYAARRRRARRARGLAAAAAIAVPLAIGVALLLQERAPAPAPEAVPAAGAIVAAYGDVRAPGAGEIAAGDTVVTGAGAAAVLELAGGARLRLDERTSLRVESRRALRLERGRVYAETGGAAEPLALATSAGTVEDIGTRFEAALAGGTLAVRVRDGRVRVAGERGAVVIGRGQAARVAAGGLPAVGAAPTHGASWDWLRRTSAPPLAGAPTVAALASWYAAEEGLELRYGSAADRTLAGEARLRGDLAALPRERLLELALESTTFRARRAGGALVIERPTD
ncbi:MAG: FecR domain-containing protein [Acidobacteria bacterium]|nr:FecR domain-containing protein [Acidobacteriota bacterium]